MEPCYFVYNNILRLEKCEGGDGVLGEVLAGPCEAINSKNFGHSACPTTEYQIGEKTLCLRKGKGGNINASCETVKRSNNVRKNSERSDIKKKGGRKNKEISGEASKATDLQNADYIHVRARRGEATDSHSLAERVRREKISERMKCLQDLVPGCNKIMGKVGMLDEIINYLQSLQRQVEFLSMKLAVVSPTATSDFHDVPAIKRFPVAFSNILPEMSSLNQMKAEPINSVDGKKHSANENIIDTYSFDHEAPWENQLENAYNIDFDQQMDICFNVHQFSELLDSGDVKIVMHPFEY